MKKQISTFEDLEVFQRSYRISLEIHKVTLLLLNSMVLPIKSDVLASQYVLTLLRDLASEPILLQISRDI